MVCLSLCLFVLISILALALDWCAAREKENSVYLVEQPPSQILGHAPPLTACASRIKVDEARGLASGITSLRTRTIARILNCKVNDGRQGNDNGFCRSGKVLW